MSRGWQITLGVVLVIGVLAVIGNLLPAQPPPAAVRSSTPAPPAPTPTEDTPASEPKPTTTPKPAVDYATEIRQATLDTLGVHDFPENCNPTDPGWTCYVTNWTSPHRGTVVVTLQVSRDDPDADTLGERAAMSVFNFAGPGHADLNVVQVLAADGSTLKTMRRDQAPLLNRS